MSTSNKIQLSPKQKDIAEFTYGALRVIAGAGSGKTRVLTERIKMLSEITKRKILAITFTNKASEEIKERLNEDIDINEKLFVGTFHSFCISVIESHGSLIGFNEVPQIFSNTDDRLKVLEAAIINTPSVKCIYEAKNAKEQGKLKYDVLDYFSKIKRDVILEEDFQSKGIDEKTILLYRTFTELMFSMNAIDFDDLLLLVYKLFISNPKIASLYRRNYEFICIDEAQDMNKAQYMLMRALTGDENKNVMLVGDPNQSIYGFNGSSSKYMQDYFGRDYNPVEVVLSENYRSSKKILELANQSNANGENNEIKLRIFGLLRNIILHFPIFDTYEEIVLSPEILKWNNPKKSSILDFFDKNKNKTIETKIYYKYPYDEKYKEIKTINIKIDMLKPGTEIMLSNIISLNDAIWMFSIVDYYLDFLGLKLNQQFGLSL